MCLILCSLFTLCVVALMLWERHCVEVMHNDCMPTCWLTHTMYASIHMYACVCCVCVLCCCLSPHDLFSQYVCCCVLLLSYTIVCCCVVCNSVSTLFTIVSLLMCCYAMLLQMWVLIACKWFDQTKWFIYCIGDVKLCWCSHDVYLIVVVRVYLSCVPECCVVVFVCFTCFASVYVFRLC